MDRTRLLNDFFDRMSTMRRFATSLYSFGAHQKGMPTRAQFAVMAAIAQEPHSVKDLATMLCMTPSAVTQIVHGLINEQLLTRTVDRNDRRKISLSLTKKGRARFTVATTHRRSSFTKLLAPLSDHDIRQLRVMQEKIIAHLSRI